MVGGGMLYGAYVEIREQLVESVFLSMMGISEIDPKS